MKLKLKKAYFTHHYYVERTKFFALGSMISNLGLGAAKIIISTIILSLYFGFNGIYTFILGMAKLYALNKHKKFLEEDNQTAQKKLEFRCVKRISYCAVAISIIYLCFGIVTTFFYEDTSRYGIGMICFIAASAFSKLVFNIIASLRFGRTKGVIIHYIKLLNIADGCVAIALTQKAILNIENNSSANFYGGLGVIVFSFIALAISLYMLIKAVIDQKKICTENI